VPLSARCAWPSPNTQSTVRPSIACQHTSVFHSYSELVIVHTRRRGRWHQDQAAEVPPRSALRSRCPAATRTLVFTDADDRDEPSAYNTFNAANEWTARRVIGVM
jgi:hypothetical protein